ncbi:MAG: hypothetical protein KGM44_12565 [bacterium]|nr:hypothetical protein [bacterium]
MRYHSEMRVHPILAVMALAIGTFLVSASSWPTPALALSSPAAMSPYFAEKPHGDHGNGDEDSGNERHGRGRANQESARGGVISGRVVSVDYGRNVFVVHAGGASRRIVLTPTTTLEERGNHPLSIGDLRPGQLVDVYMTIVGGEPIAQIVRLH